MQLNPVYLYPNLHDVYFNINGEWPIERYHRVYAKNLKIHRGLDNRVDFQVKNSDQKKQDITGLIPVLLIVSRESQQLILEKDLTYLDNDPTTGRVFTTISQTELESVEPGSYQYSVIFETRVTDGAYYRVSQRKPGFVDSQHGAIGVIEIVKNVFGAAKESLEIKNFAEIRPSSVGEDEATSYISSLIDAQYQLTNSLSLHSFAFYMDSYSGDVTIEGSLDDSADPSVWATLDEITYTNSGLASVNVEGKWKWFRIKHIPTSGTLDKILYR